MDIIHERIHHSNNESTDSSSVDIAWFYPPAESYSSRQNSPSISISVDFPDDPQDVKDLANYLNFTTDAYSDNFTDPNFNVITSNSCFAYD
jgi:hypothetical protein